MRDRQHRSHTGNGSSVVTLPGVSCLVQELRHLCGFPAARLATQHHTLVFLHRLHDDLLLRQDRQPQTSLLQFTRRITPGVQNQEPNGSKTAKSIDNFIRKTRVYKWTQLQNRIGPMWIKSKWEHGNIAFMHNRSHCVHHIFINDYDHKLKCILIFADTILITCFDTLYFLKFLK